MHKNIHPTASSRFSITTTHIRPYCLFEDESAYKAYYLIQHSVICHTIFVLNEKEELVGIIARSEFIWTGSLYFGCPSGADRIIASDATCGDICNRNFVRLSQGQDIYLQARNEFAKKRMTDLPVLDNNGLLIDIIGKWQAYYLDYFERRILPRMYFAEMLFDSAKRAKLKGYERISTMEFGVAAGNGLSLLEKYAYETSQLTGVAIDIYGFDTFDGLLESDDVRDAPQNWVAGDFKADEQEVIDRLQRAILVVGDINKTSKTFLTEYSPAPIGSIAIDVDVYTPCKSILNMLLGDDKYFMPEVVLYFDDLQPNLEYQGEHIAIKEFNAEVKNMKIVPESTDYWSKDWGRARLKMLNRYSHPKFSNKREASIQKTTY